MSSLVTKGNTIYVPVQFLGGSEGKKTKVTWQQAMRTRDEEYWLCKYTVKSGGSGEGIIFVQDSKLEEFKSKKTTEDEITVVVTDSFQYGQNKEQTKRFLVYHDKEHKPYQHRFVENMYSQMGGQAASFIQSMGYKDVGKVEDLIKHFIGDYLHNY